MTDPAHRSRPFEVPPLGAGRRADQYLGMRFTHISRSAVRRYMSQGMVTRDGRVLKASSILNAGDVLLVAFPGIAPTGPPPPPPPVIYEDERLLVVDKPAGMLCHPAGDTFVYAVVGLIKDARPHAQVDLLHRLDRETSGVMALTKDMAANRYWKAAFQTRSVRKRYLAICRGVVPWDNLSVHAPIGSDVRSEVRLKKGVCADGMPAHTEFEVVQRMAAHTLVAVTLHTGRQHQIRVHLMHAGFPLLGDKLYGQPDAVFLAYLNAPAGPEVRAAVGFPRHALHAWTLSLPTPEGDRIDLCAPLPADLQAIVDGAAPDWPTPSSEDPP